MKPLSKSEMEIVRVVWQLKSASVRQVHDEISQRRKIDFTTVQTYLTRLADKGYLKFRLDGRSRIYSAKARPDRVILNTVNEFVGGMFGGEPLPLIRHLIDETEISPEQAAELRQLLNEATGKKDESA